MEIYQHNIDAYKEVRDALQSCGIAAIVMPTGSGKSYVAYQLVAENIDKHILYVTAYKSNRDQFQELITSHLAPGNMDFTIYMSLDPSSGYDIIILDEIHRCGADTWNKSVQHLLDLNPEARILGMSATPIRYLDNMRNMATELFADNIVYELSPGEAMAADILPIPHYFGGVYSFSEELDRATRTLTGSSATEDVKASSMKILDRVRHQIENSDGVKRILEDHIYHDGKYLAFCKDYAHLLEMEEKCEGWLGGIPHRFFICYSAKRDCEKNYADFLSEKGLLSICFCIDMLNEGVHPEIDGGIFFRPTDSMNVYIQQTGRVFSSGKRDRPPQVFDFVNNYKLLTEAREYWQDIISGLERHGRGNELKFMISEESIDIQDIFDEFYTTLSLPLEKWVELFRGYYTEHGTLEDITKSTIYKGYRLGQQARNFRERYVNRKLPENIIQAMDMMGFIWDPISSRWAYSMVLAKEYCRETGNTLADVKARDTYKGWKIGNWILNLRLKRNSGIDAIPADKISGLDALGMYWGRKKDDRWMSMFSLVMGYIQKNSVSINDIEHDTEYEGEPIGNWLRMQRQFYKNGHLAEERYQMLSETGFLFDLKNAKWMASYECYKEYIELDQLDPNEIEYRAVTPNGEAIGQWFKEQLSSYQKGKMSPERIDLLRSIGYKFMPTSEYFWLKNYSILKNLYGKRDLNRITYREVIDGMKVGMWLSTQCKNQRKGTLPEDKEKLLKELDINFSLKDTRQKPRK